MKIRRIGTTEGRIDLGSIAKATKGATFGRIDIGGGEQMPLSGLAND